MEIKVQLLKFPVDAYRHCFKGCMFELGDAVWLKFSGESSRLLFSFSVYC